MGPKTERLIAVLEEIIPFLRENGEDYYADWMAKGKLLLEQSDFRGISHILRAFGGMGSFNDRALTPSDVKQAKEDQISANQRLQMLSSTIYDLADSIRREVDRGDR